MAQRRRAARAAGRPFSLNIEAVRGQGSATQIDVPGLRVEDELIAVIEARPPTATSDAEFGDNLASVTTIPANGKILVGGTNSSLTQQCLVFWWSFES